MNDLHEQIIEKFYKNYIEKGLNEYERNIDEHDFGAAYFLNMSINLNDYINQDFKLYLTEYRNLTKNQIQFLFEKNIQTLDKIFNFSTIKSKINNEIDNVYNISLLPELEKAGVHKMGDEGVSNYDLSDSILSDIDQFITDKISNAKNIIKEMEGKEYQINSKAPTDFSVGKNSIYKNISNMFKTFYSSFQSQEKKELDKAVGEIAFNNFETLIDNFILNFGVDFFDRILKYNELQKIKVLYFNLRYSLIETIIYYIGLATDYNDIKLPVDIKLKLFKMNNFDSIAVEKNNYILSILNDKLNGYFEETKNYIVQKYIDEITISEEFDLKFKTEMKNKIITIIRGNIHKYEDKYINLMTENVKIHFIEQYTRILNEDTKEIKNYIEKEQIQLKSELDNIFSLDSDSVIAEIETKLNKTIKVIEEYNSHFTNVNLPEEVITFLNNFGEDIIASKYKNIKDLLDKRTEELIFNNLEKLSNEFIEEYSFDNFKNMVDQSDRNLSLSINKINTIINKYGSIEEVYKQNLEKEIANYGDKKLLEKVENNDNNEQKREEITLDKTFNKLKNLSQSTKDFVESLDLFNNFEININNYINEKNKQYSNTLNNLEQNMNNNNNYEVMLEELEKLNQLSIDYYSRAKNIYNIMKEQLININ